MQCNTVCSEAPAGPTQAARAQPAEKYRTRFTNSVRIPRLPLTASFLDIVTIFDYTRLTDYVAGEVLLTPSCVALGVSPVEPAAGVSSR